MRPYKYEDESWREEEWKSPISGLSFRIDDEAFPEITFENSPQQGEDRPLHTAFYNVYYFENDKWYRNNLIISKE